MQLLRWTPVTESYESDSQESKLYPTKMYKLFLQQTMKGLDLEKHFPDKLLFYQSAFVTDLMDQEIFKQMFKVRK